MPETTMSPQEAAAFLDDRPAPPPGSTDTNVIPMQVGAPAKLLIGDKPPMSPEEAEAFLSGGAARGAGQPYKPPLAPVQILSGLGKIASDVVGGAISPETEEQYKAKNQIEGVPLDTQTGLPAGVRLAMSFYDTPEEKMSYLQSRYGKDAVRQDTRGGMVVRQFGQDGKPMDVLADERGMSLKDIAETLTGALPQVIGSAVGYGLAGKIASKSPILMRALGSSIGAGMGDAAKKSLAGQAINIPTKPMDVLAHATRETAVNLAFDLGMAAGVKSFMRFASPFGRNPDKVTLNALAAEQFFADQGILTREEQRNLLTIAERTGSPFLAKGEAVTSAFYRARRTIEERMTSAMEAKLKIQDSIAGIGDDAVFGSQREAVDALEGSGAALRRFINDEMALPARSSVIAEADRVIKETTDRIMKLHGSPTQSYQTAEAMSASATQKLEAYKQQRDDLYAKAKAALGGGDNKIIPVGKLTQEAQAFLDKLPRATKVGGEGPELLDAFIKPKAFRNASELATIDPGEKLSIDELIRIRGEISDDILIQRSAIPGVDTRDLTSLRTKVTEAIHDGLEQVPNPDAKKLYMAAESFVRDNQSTFELPGMEKMFWKSGPNPNAWMNDLKKVRITDSANNIYEDAKKFYGEASPEWGLIKKSLRHDLLQQSMEASRDLLDGESLVGNLVQFARNNPKVFAEVFPNSNAIRIAAEKSWAASLLRRGAKVDSEEVLKILDGHAPARDLDELVAAQAKSDATFRGNVMKQFRSGEPMDIPAEKFVSTFLYQSGDQEVRDVMSKVTLENPELAKRIERAALTDLFLKAQRRPAAGRPMTDGGPWQLADPGQLRKTLEENRGKLNMVLGEDTKEKLAGFMHILEAGARRDAMGGLAGSLAAGGDMASWLHFPFNVGDGLLSKLTRQVNAGIVATLLTNRTVERLMGNSVFRQLPEREKFAMVFLATPVLAEITEQYGQEEAHAIGQAINEGLGRASKTEQLLKQTQ